MISRGFLYLLTFLVPVLTLGITRDSLNFPKVTFFSVSVLVVIFLFLLDFILTKQAAFRKSVVDTPVLLLMLALFLSAVGSVMPGESFFGKPEVFVLHFFGLLLLGAFYMLMVQLIHHDRHWYGFLFAFLAAGVYVVVSHFVSLLNVDWLEQVFRFNTIGQTLSEYVMFSVVLIVLTSGLSLKRQQPLWQSILMAVVALLGFVVLAQLDFAQGWILLAVGLASLLVVGFTHLAQVRTWAISLVFAFFVLSLGLMFFDVPESMRAVRQYDIALGAGPSYDIAKDTILDNVKYFLIGSGSGTFSYVFSLFRDPAFNTLQIAAFERFSVPVSTFPAIVAEMGVLGAGAFVILVLVALGSVFGGWMRIRPTSSSDTKHFFGGKSTISFDVFAVGSAFLALTVGFFTLYFGFTLWFMWWLMLGLLLAGLHKLVPEYVKEKVVVLKVAPQYSLLLSFGLVVALGVIVFYSSVAYGKYMGEYAYTQATQKSAIVKIEKDLNRAITLQPKNAQYITAMAKLSLQKARAESEKPDADVQTVVRHIDRAIALSKQASEAAPNSIETWETQAIMYINARPIAQNANQWALTTLSRAIELEPSNAILHWRLADAYAYNQELDKAEESYKSAIQLKPDFVQAYLALANVFEDTNRVNDAIIIHKPIMPAIQDNPDALFNLGRLFYNRGQEGDLDSSKQIFERVITIEPQYSNAHYSLGLLYERDGDVDKAKKHLEKVLELNPDNEDVKVRLQAL